jgi:hypothetical protein
MSFFPSEFKIIRITFKTVVKAFRGYDERSDEKERNTKDKKVVLLK